jgi:hypothetical protein
MSKPPAKTTSNLKLEELKRLMPIQNDGASAAQIARICERILHIPLNILRSRRKLAQQRLKREHVDAY